MAQSHMREFTLGPMSESRSAPGGHRLACQTANLNFWVRVVLLLNHEVDAHSPSFGEWKAGSTIGIAVNLAQSCIYRSNFVKNAETCPQSGFNHGTSHAAGKHATTKPLQHVIVIDQ